MKEPSPATYEQMGLATTLVGMRRAYEVLGLEIRAIEKRLNGLLGEAPAPAARKRSHSRTGRRAGRPSGPAVNTGWPADPEERSREMKRRMEVAKAKKRATAKGAGPKRHWAKMTVRQRREHLAKMQAGRAAQVAHAALTKPNGAAA